MSFTLPQDLVPVTKGQFNYNPHFAHMTDPTTAIFLCKALEYTKLYGDAQGRFTRTSEQWLQDTGLSARQYDKARKKLKMIGVLTEHRQSRTSPVIEFYISHGRLIFCLHRLEKCREELDKHFRVK